MWIVLQCSTTRQVRSLIQFSNICSIMHRSHWHACWEARISLQKWKVNITHAHEESASQWHMWHVGHLLPFLRRRKYFILFLLRGILIPDVHVQRLAQFRVRKYLTWLVRTIPTVAWCACCDTRLQKANDTTGLRGSPSLRVWMIVYATAWLLQP